MSDDVVVLFVGRIDQVHGDAQAEPSADTVGQPAKIVVVRHGPSLRSGMVRYLKCAGHIIDVARSRLEALVRGDAAIHETETVEILAVGPVDPAPVADPDLRVADFGDVVLTGGVAAEQRLAGIEVENDPRAPRTIGVKRVFLGAAIERQTLGKGRAG